MDKPFCEKCGKGIYLNGVDIDPSSGLQTTYYRCFSLNTRHDTYKTEPIPDWEEFKRERKEKSQHQGYAISIERILEISSMLAKSIPQLQIAKELRCSCTTIRNVRGITLLAAVGAVLRGMR